MAVLITILFCAVIFLLYLLNRNRNEISELKAEIHRLNQNDSNMIVAPPVDEKIFVSVIFKEHDQKYYDYFLGNNHDVKVGDFVEVYFSNKISGKTECCIAKVVYISKPGEVSKYARSKIKRKIKPLKW